MRIALAFAALLVASTAMASAVSVSDTPKPKLVKKVTHHHWRRHHRVGSLGLLEAQLFKPPRSRPVPASPPPPAGVIAQLQSMIPAWEAADAIAVGPDPAKPIDADAHICYIGVVTFLQGLAPPSPGIVIDATSPLLQAARARVAKLQAQPPPSASLKVGDVRAGCGALFAESDAAFLARLAALAGLAVDPTAITKAGIGQ